MDEQYAVIIRKLEAAALALETAVVAGADYYANGSGSMRPGVFKHYTAGNQARYGWAPLSARYAASKTAGIFHLSPGAGLFVGKHALRRLATLKADRDKEMKAVGKSGALMGAAEISAKRKDISARYQPYIDAVVKLHAGANRTGAKLEPQSVQRDPRIFGKTKAGKAASSLPMLVRTGRLRDAVCTIHHPITKDGDIAFITFQGLPDYAMYHQTGTKRMPRRSPVDPNDLDRAEIKAAMERYIDAQIGTGKDVPVSKTTIPGVARTK